MIRRLTVPFAVMLAAALLLVSCTGKTPPAAESSAQSDVSFSSAVPSEEEPSGESITEESSEESSEEESSEESSEEESSEESSEESYDMKEREPLGITEYVLSPLGLDPVTGYYTYERTAVHPGTSIAYIGSGVNAAKVVVIDAGHQKHAMNDKEPNSPSTGIMKMKVTGGTTGKYTHIHEYDLNLAVALLLRDELVARGYTVVMVRETNDVKISNIQRAEIANRYSASVNIRIHANSASDRSVNGALGICQTAANPDCGFMYNECRLLTEVLMKSFCSATAMPCKGIWETDTMTGVNWCKVPTTIIEMGYMSNSFDDTYMATDEFHINAALGIADGIEAYLCCNK